MKKFYYGMKLEGVGGGKPTAVSNSLGNGINPQFNFLSHLPNMGQQVELEIGSLTKHQRVLHHLWPEH